MSLQKVTVLGTGLVGKAIVHDLSQDSAVTAVDRSAGSLSRVAHLPCERICCDISDDDTLRRVVEDSDMVVSALPGAAGFELLQRLILLRKHVVDISFSIEDPLALDPLARENGVVVIPDAGVCPGLSNLVCGFAAGHLLPGLRSYVCYVGGLPLHPSAPWFYKNPFAAESVVDEYIRPARFRIDGKQVVRPALSDPEKLDIPAAGELIAFNTDGIRTLLDTLPGVDTLIEKTLRHPEHYDFVSRLQQTGFLSETKAGSFTDVVREAWRFDDGEEDITVMRLVFEDDAKRITYDLYDRYDPEAGLLSMARTTGFTAATIARVLLSGKITAPGVHAPERLGMDRPVYESVLAQLGVHGVSFAVTSEDLPQRGAH